MSSNVLDRGVTEQVNAIVNNMTEQNKYLTTIQEKVIRESKRLEKSNRELYELTQKLQDELEEKGQSSDECLQNMRELNKQIERLKAEIETKNKDIRDLEDLNAQVEEKVKDLEKQLENKQQEIDDIIEREGLNKEEAIRLKQEEIDQLVEEKNNLKDDLETIKKLEEDKIRKIADLENDLRDHKSQLEKEREEKESIQQEASELKDQLKKCEELNERLQERLKEMDDKNEEIIQEKEALQDAIQELKKEIIDQLEYIMQQKIVLIDAPVSELRRNTEDMKRFADEAEANMNKADMRRNRERSSPSQRSPSDLLIAPTVEAESRLSLPTVEAESRSLGREVSLEYLKEWLAKHKICSAECALNARAIAWALTHPDRVPTLQELNTTDSDVTREVSEILEAAAADGQISMTRAASSGAEQTRGLFDDGEKLYYVTQGCTEDCENKYEFVSIRKRGENFERTQRKRK